MREIKFRAWYEHTPIMIYVDPKANSQSYGKVESNAELFRLADINNYELMQYTGLKDKNGKEIYEGDIVKAKSYDYEAGKDYTVKADVVYDTEQFIGYRIGGTRMSACHSFEVIGNIYENKDLLNG